MQLDPNTLENVAGIKAATLVFSFIGAAVSLSYAKEMTRAQAVTAVLAGTAVAVSAAPLALHYLGLREFGPVRRHWQALPDGIRPPPMNRQAWREVFSHPRLMRIVAVTALAGAGQFTLFAYIAPYLRQGLSAQASEISLVFACFGSLGLIGNLWLSQRVDQLGAARAVGWLLAPVPCRATKSSCVAMASMRSARIRPSAAGVLWMSRSRVTS